MSKIVLAVNSMISNAEKITDVSQYESEYFFKYDTKYIWGILKKNEMYSLFFYPETKEINELYGVVNWDQVPLVAYNTGELKTREALESFKELYLIVKEKIHNMEGVLDDIIGNL